MKLGQQITSCIEKLHFDHVYILYILHLGLKKCFFMKTLLILPRLREKTLSRSGDIKIFRPGGRMYMYTLPPFTNEGLSEERKLIKWVKIFQVRIL